jgi:dihydroxy-acid dehydratase
MTEPSAPPPSPPRSAAAATAAATTKDYDLTVPIDPSATGLRQKLPGYGDAHFSLFMRNLFIKALGYSEDALSRPIVGVINTYSGFNPCHANVPQLMDAVKRGVQLHGGLAIDFPTISLHESFSSPTSMYLRNLMSMDTEEMIHAQPVDSVVLIGGAYGTSLSLSCLGFDVCFSFSLQNVG